MRSLGKFTRYENYSMKSLERQQELIIIDMYRFLILLEEIPLLAEGRQKNIRECLRSSKNVYYKIS